MTSETIARPATVGELRNWELPNGRKPSVCFYGRKRASVDSRRAGAKRWTELVAFETEGGNWIMQVIGRTVIPEEDDRSSVLVFKSLDGMADTIGYSPLNARLLAAVNAKRVYVD